MTEDNEGYECRYFWEEEKPKKLAVCERIELVNFSTGERTLIYDRSGLGSYEDVTDKNRI